MYVSKYSHVIMWDYRTCGGAGSEVKQQLQAIRGLASCTLSLHPLSAAGANHEYFVFFLQPINQDTYK